MKFKVLALSILTLILFTACSSKVEYIDQANSKDYTSKGLDIHDFTGASEKLVKSLLSSGYVVGLSNQKSPKVLVISDVINDTMQKIDVEQLTRKITRDMRNSGKFALTQAMAGSGGTKDKMIDKTRKERENKEFDQYTVADEGNLKAPSLSLNGKIIQRNVKVESKQRIDYVFILSLVDIKTGLVVWDDEDVISKLGDNNSASW